MSVILMAGSQFASTRQLMMKNMPASALDNPAAKMQKKMMYFLPLMFVFSGVTFVIGLLLYMLTTNLWTMGQQFYTIRRMPAPGSLAEKALEARQLKSGKDTRSPPSLAWSKTRPKRSRTSQPPIPSPHRVSVINPNARSGSSRQGRAALIRPAPSHWSKHERCIGDAT